MRKILFCASLVLACVFSFTQDLVVQNLVFEGAGIRGIAYSGAIRELEENKLLINVQRFGGTSAGAITALLLSIGYNSDEITGIINSTSFKKFNDGKFIFPGGINRLQKYYGWYKGRRFENWLSKLIENKTGNSNITFAQLKHKGFKELYITGTCLNQQKLIIFSNESYPSMRVKDAVRISMSIPLYFEAVFINKEGKIINHPKNKNGLDIMIDGGIIANFPIRMFDSTKYFNKYLPNKFATNPHTIGIRIDREEQVINDSTGHELAPMQVNSLPGYLSAFYNLIIENLNRQTLTSHDWERTVSISDGDISPRIRKLDDAEINLLISNGYLAAKSFLTNKLQNTE